MAKPRIIIVGGGFGGLAAAKALRNTPAEIILIDRTNHHLFQPLLYQVATSVLTPSQIATPIRSDSSESGEHHSDSGRSHRSGQGTRSASLLATRTATTYRLTMTTWSSRLVPRHSYFGHNEFAKFAPGIEEPCGRRGDPKQNPAGVRTSRGRRRSEPPSGPADFHPRWRWSYRRGDGWRYRCARANHSEIRLPADRSDLRTNCARRYGAEGLGARFRRIFRKPQSNGSRNWASRSGSGTASIRSTLTASWSRASASRARPLSGPQALHRRRQASG